jgi:hypothetical protein
MARGLGGYRALMSRTRFTSRIRIDPKQLEWLRKNKGKRKTLAGRLDEIINFYKEYGNIQDPTN